MITLFGTTYFTAGLALILFCFISSIVLLIFRPFSAKASRERKRAFFIVELVLFGLLHWDIIVAGHQVSKMCREQGGMHIYKTVEADSMAGLFGIKYWSEYGFSYVEDNDSRGNIIRRSMINGEIVKERVDKITSQYIRITKRENVGRLVDKSFIIRITHTVNDRADGAILGELIYFTIDQGWADHWLPGEYTPWKFCNKTTRNGSTVSLGIDELVKNTVIPKKK